VYNNHLKTLLCVSR